MPDDTASMTDLVARARRYATEAHARIDHRRKYSNQPYDVHLRNVAALVAEAGGDAAMVAAAWLHDTVEDTPATFRDIEQAFGRDVAVLVAELTDVSKPSDGNRAARKAIDRDHLARASARGKTIKLADLIDNCRDICRHDPRFARVFLAEMEALLEVLGEGDAGLMRRARKAHAKCRGELDRLALRPAGEAAQPPDLPGDTADGLHRHALRQFMGAFAARDIAEPIASFDAATPADTAREAMQVNGWIVAGVRDGGRIVGYLRSEDLVDGVCGDHHRRFSRGQVVSADASLSEVIHVLTRYTGCYVDIIGEIGGVVLRDHVQKPLVRMWLFGMITVIEMGVTRRLATTYAGDDWQARVAPGRLAKARDLQAERARRGGSAPNLLDCLQLSDKIQLLIRDDAGLAWMGFSSRSVAKGVAREFESLRNNLAHAQDIVSTDWAQIARMTQRFEYLLGSGDE
jgi:hypothetical protein